MLLFLIFTIKSAGDDSFKLFSNGSHSSSDFSKYHFGGGVAISAGSIGIYKLYKWANQEVSNKELSQNAQDVYDKIHETYGSIDFLYRPQKLTIKHVGQLFELAEHKDIAAFLRKKAGTKTRRIANIGVDLPQLFGHISILSNRLQQDQNAGKSVDHYMANLLKTMEKFRDDLKGIKLFWDTHAVFFSVHTLFTELSDTYKLYDYRNSSAVKMKIRDNTIEKEEKQLYPFKCFGEKLAKDIMSLEEHIEPLYSKAKQFDEESATQANYRSMLAQVESLCRQLICLRDVVANLEEYLEDVENYKKAQLVAEVKRADEKSGSWKTY